MKLIKNAHEFRLSLVRFHDLPVIHKDPAASFFYEKYTKYIWGERAPELSLVPIRTVASSILSKLENRQ